MSLAPFFSVVIPVYNRANCLGNALRSVLSQSEKNFEIVVVDDGSCDDPKTVVKSFHDPRIDFVRQSNRGGGAARNLGIDHARGRFIAFLDSDDEFFPHHLQSMRELLEETDRTAGYAQIVVDRGGGRRFLKPPRALLAGEDIATYLLCDRGFIPSSTLVVPAELAVRVRYHEDLAEAEDTDFAIRLALAGCHFLMAGQPGAIYTDRFDPERLSARRSSPRLAKWLEAMRPNIARSAYLGGLGWAVAKGVALSSRTRALKLYLVAVANGCYGPRLAVIIFLQVFLPDRVYRVIADRVISLFGAIG